MTILQVKDKKEYEARSIEREIATSCKIESFVKRNCPKINRLEDLGESISKLIKSSCNQIEEVNNF